MTVFENVTLFSHNSSLFFKGLLILNSEVGSEVRICVLTLLVDLAETSLDIYDGRVGTP